MKRPAPIAIGVLLAGCLIATSAAASNPWRGETDGAGNLEPKFVERPNGVGRPSPSGLVFPPKETKPAPPPYFGPFPPAYPPAPYGYPFPPFGMFPGGGWPGYGR